MGAELGASRLVAPYYGSSTPVWALLVSTVLAALALGNALAGRLPGARQGRAAVLALLGAGLALLLLPLLGPPLLGWSLDRFGRASVLAAVALALGLLLSLPLALLGLAGPLLLRLAQRESEPGRAAARIYALGSAGSLLGTLLTGLVLLPALGTRRSFWCWGGLLLAAGLLLLLRGRGRLLAPLALLLPLPLPREGPVHGGAIYAAETPLNHVEVVERGGVRLLLLQDGHAVQSVYPLDGSLPLYDVWAWYAVAPAFTGRGRPRRVLFLGLGGGTAARIYRVLYPEAELTGVELDPGVVEAGRRFLGLPAELRVEIADARAWLRRDPGRYDLVLVDAFQFPYIPFQLATREFFEAVAGHLAPGGAVLVNAGRWGDAHDVVDAVARSMAAAFPHVRGADVRNPSNTVLVGSFHPPGEDAGLEALGLPPGTALRLSHATGPLRPWRPGPGPLLTDDRAPVEFLTDRIALRWLAGLLRGRGRE